MVYVSENSKADADLSWRNKMKFDEMFPSLKGKANFFNTWVEEDGKGKEKGYLARVKGEPAINVADENWVYVKEIKEHCLDKAKVKEVIDKIDKIATSMNKKWLKEEKNLIERKKKNLLCKAQILVLNELKKQLGLE